MCCELNLFIRHMPKTEAFPKTPFWLVHLEQDIRLQGVAGRIHDMTCNSVTVYFLPLQALVYPVFWYQSHLFRGVHVAVVRVRPKLD